MSNLSEPVEAPRNVIQSIHPAVDRGDMLMVRSIHFAPYLQLATALKHKKRHSGGNMFRHQVDSFAILLDYDYIDSVLLKATLVHDLLEDVPDFPREQLIEADEEGPAVYQLVLEVSRRSLESKAEFLTRVYDFGSERAHILKSADRISNMISLGYVTDRKFVERYVHETEKYVFPIARQCDQRMFDELRSLVASRKEALALPGNMIEAK